MEYGQKKSQQNREISLLEEIILSEYRAKSPDDKVKFFAELYDDFSASYDRHFGEETGHYTAIKHVLFFAAPYLRFPILDITAGTGEPLKYALEFMSATSRLRAMTSGAGEVGSPASGIESLFPHLPELRGEDVENKDLWIYVNEISDKMRVLAEAKLGHYPKINFTRYNALSLQTTHLRQKFNTALCSQTFHLMPHEDKVKLARSMFHSLNPGGIAVVIEEDPFRISHTPPIEPVALIIRTIACPIENRGDLIGLFKNLGFIKLEPRAVWDIEGPVKHAMRLYLFMKPLNGNQDSR